MRVNLHQSKPPMDITMTPNIRIRFERRGGSPAGTGGISVDGRGVMDVVGVDSNLVGLGVSVAVAGGVTRRSNF